MATITLDSIKKHYGNVAIIHGVDLDIGDGEFVALVGPSGCGKSTLLRMIAGLEPITEGEVSIGDAVVNNLTPRQRNVAMVFQSYALYPHMTVAGNMAFNLELAGNSKTQIAQKIAEAARMLGLEDLLDRKPSQLSGGQRQRVAMGRAVVRNPAVFLFDEPLSNLDAKLRVQMRAEIKTLHQKVRTTSIYVTHDQIEAMTLADRIVVLNKGRIEQQGSPLELYRNPANLFVAGFIGSPSMNVLDAVAHRDPSGLFAILGDYTRVPLPENVRLADQQAIKIGIRPEQLGIAGTGVELKGIVRMVEPTGAQTHVTMDSAGGSVTTVLDGNSTIPAIGEGFIVRLAEHGIHLFDAETGARITSSS